MLSERLDMRDETRGFRPILGIPEFVTRLDDHRGEHRNHDLIVAGETEAAVPTLLSIEAKADERFGSDEIGAYHSKMRGVPRSRVPDRIQGLARAIFGSDVVLQDGTIDPSVGRLRYQLLTAVAGALIEARRRWAWQAIFVVHEFRSNDNPGHGYRGTRDVALEENRLALQAFVDRLSRGGHSDIERGLAGPFTVPGGGYVPASMPLFIGKVSELVRPFEH